MAIVLQKGQRIDLTKGNPGLEKIMVGLGWDPVQKKASGLRGMFSGGGGSSFDIDASVIMLQNDKFAGKENLIYFGNLKSSCGSIVHTGDNLTGDGDGDDEQILIELKKIPASVNKLVFVVNIYDCKARKQDFGMVKNAFIRVVNSTSKEELLKFSLSEDYSGSTSLLVAEIYRNGADWKFAAVGTGTQDAGLSEIVQKFA